MAWLFSMHAILGKNHYSLIITARKQLKTKCRISLLNPYLDLEEKVVVCDEKALLVKIACLSIQPENRRIRKLIHPV